eukprot:m.14394 g.14394  ORF g.14394 m.14394 type:complete len:103 (+) comp5078_c0_seq1:204-512(+)
MARFGGREDLYEAENDKNVELMAQRVKGLKHVSLDIGQSIKDSNRYLNGMDDDMSSSSGMLGGSLTRLQRLNAGSPRTMCSLVGILVGFFMILWMVSSRNSS